MNADFTLFLDFDGVLHPEFCHERRHFEALPLLAATLANLPSVEVVVSSTWRLQMNSDRKRYGLRSLDEVRKWLEPDVSTRVEGLTPHALNPEEVPDRLIAYEREAQCVAWLHEHRPHRIQWLAVDDRPWLFRPFSSNLFLVDGKTGLTPESCAQLMAKVRAMLV